MDGKGTNKRQVVILALVLAGTVSQASQYLLSFLFSVSQDHGAKYSIQAALHLTPYLFSILVGYASGGPRALTQFLAGQAGSSILTHRSLKARAILLGSALAVQALGTSLLGQAQTRVQTFCAQIVTGLGSGPLYPMGYAMIALTFEARQLGMPNGMLSQTNYFGPAISSLCVVVARTFGWRIAVRAIAACLVAAALLVVVTAYDDNTVLAAEQKPIQRQHTTTIVYTRAAAAFLALGGGARYAAGYAVPSYVPYYFEHTFPARLTQFSTYHAAAILTCGSTSALLGGALAQAFAARKHEACRPSDYLVIPILSCFFGGLAALITFTARSFAAAVAALFVMQLCGEAWLAGTVAALRLLVDDDAAFGIFYTVATFVGCLNLLVLGSAVSDTSPSIRHTMILFVAFPYFIAVCLLVVAARLAASGDSAFFDPLHAADVKARASPSPTDAVPLLASRDAAISQAPVPALESASEDSSCE